MTLILFDIDGTLLLSEGAGGRAMRAAGSQVLGPRFSLEGVKFAGCLDSSILVDGFIQSGFPVDATLIDRVRATYRELLAQELATGCAYALPGVLELLGHLRQRDSVTLGLLTGNFPETGRLKLEAAAIDPDQFVVCAWGSDGSARTELPPVAMRRYEEQHGRAIASEEVVIVGDTPNDIACARANGCRVIAVATGPSIDRAGLASHEPDLVFDDLSNTDEVLAALRA